MDLAEKIVILRRSGLSRDAIGLLLDVSAAQIEAQVADPDVVDPAPSGGGGGGGTSVLAVVADAGPTALGDPDAVSGYPPLLATADFTLTESTLVIAGAGGRIDPSYDDAGQRPTIMAHIHFADDPDAADLSTTGPWGLTLIYPDGGAGAVTYQWLNPVGTSDPYSPVALPAGDYTLNLRAGLAASGGSPATGLDMKAWAVKLG